MEDLFETIGIPSDFSEGVFDSPLHLSFFIHLMMYVDKYGEFNGNYHFISNDKLPKFKENLENLRKLKLINYHMRRSYLELKINHFYIFTTEKGREVYDERGMDIFNEKV